MWAQVSFVLSQCTRLTDRQKGLRHTVRACSRSVKYPGPFKADNISTVLKGEGAMLQNKGPDVATSLTCREA